MAGQQRVAPQLGRVGLPFRSAQQLGAHQHVKQLHGLVDGPDLKPARGGQQRRDAPGARQPPQRRGLRRHAVASQLDHPPRRDTAQVTPAHPELADLRGSGQRGHHRPARHGARTVAPTLQKRHPRTLGHLEYPVEPTGLRRADLPCEDVVDPLGGALADPGNQPGQGAHPRQQDLPLAQPAHRAGEQRLRTVPGGERTIAHPALQLSRRRRERAVAVGLDDLSLMIEPRRAPPGVALHTRRIGHPQLAGDLVEHHRRHVQRVDQEQPQRPHRHQL